MSNLEFRMAQADRLRAQCWRDDCAVRLRAAEREYRASVEAFADAEERLETAAATLRKAEAPVVEA